MVPPQVATGAMSHRDDASTLDRSRPSYWAAFYRDQARLMWEWRATRLSLVRRAVLSYLGAIAALWIIAAISPDLTLAGPDRCCLRR